MTILKKATIVVAYTITFIFAYSDNLDSKDDATILHLAITGG